MIQRASCVSGHHPNQDAEYPPTPVGSQRLLIAILQGSHHSVLCHWQSFLSVLELHKNEAVQNTLFRSGFLCSIWRPGLCSVEQFMPSHHPPLQGTDLFYHQCACVLFPVWSYYDKTLWKVCMCMFLVDVSI